ATAAPCLRARRTPRRCAGSSSRSASAAPLAPGRLRPDRESPPAPSKPCVVPRLPRAAIAQPCLCTCESVQTANQPIKRWSSYGSLLSFDALEPIRQGVHGCFGGFAKGVGRGLAVNRSEFVGGDFGLSQAAKGMPLAW